MAISFSDVDPGDFVRAARDIQLRDDGALVHAEIEIGDHVEFICPVTDVVGRFRYQGEVVYLTLDDVDVDDNIFDPGKALATLASMAGQRGRLNITMDIDGEVKIESDEIATGWQPSFPDAFRRFRAGFYARYA